MFKTLNAFTARVDELFDRMLTMPFITTKDCNAALKLLQTKLNAEFGGDVGAMLKKEREVVSEMMELIGVTSYERACVVLNHCLRHLTDAQGVTAASSIISIGSIMSGKSNPAQPSTPRGARPPRRRRGTAASVASVRRPSCASGSRSRPRRWRGAGALIEEEPCFFSAAFVSQFGCLVDSGCKGKYESHGAFQVPLDAAAYCACLPTHAGRSARLRGLLLAPPRGGGRPEPRRGRQPLDGPPPRPTAAGSPTTTSTSSCSRARRAGDLHRARAADLWRPDKVDHRRRLMPGVWAPAGG